MRLSRNDLIGQTNLRSKFAIHIGAERDLIIAILACWTEHDLEPLCALGTIFNLYG